MLLSEVLLPYASIVLVHEHLGTLTAQHLYSQGNKAMSHTFDRECRQLDKANIIG